MPRGKAKSQPRVSHNITVVQPSPLVQGGGNIFHDIGNGIKKAAHWTYDNAIKPGFKYVKDQKLISKALSSSEDPRAKTAGALAAQFGLGHRPHMMQGAGKHVGSSNL